MGVWPHKKIYQHRPQAVESNEIQPKPPAQAQVRDKRVNKNGFSLPRFFPHTNSDIDESNPGSGKRPKFNTTSLRVDRIHFHHCNNDKIKAMLKTKPIKIMLALWSKNGLG